MVTSKGYTTSELASMRTRLEAELKDAEKQLRELEQQLEDRPEFSLGEGSSGAQWWEMALGRRERVEAHVQDINEAFERFDEGTYGACSRCGKLIDPERLDILPTTTLCSDCAREVSD